MRLLSAGEGASLTDTVTVRNRDTMIQERIAISELKGYLEKSLAEKILATES